MYYSNEEAAMAIIRYAEYAYRISRGMGKEKISWISMKRYHTWNIIDSILCHPGCDVIGLIDMYRLEYLSLNNPNDPHPSNLIFTADETAIELLNLLS